MSDENFYIKDALISYPAGVMYTFDLVSYNKEEALAIYHTIKELYPTHPSRLIEAPYDAVDGECVGVLFNNDKIHDDGTMEPPGKIMKLVECP